MGAFIVYTDRMSTEQHILKAYSILGTLGIYLIHIFDNNFTRWEISSSHPLGEKSEDKAQKGNKWPSVAWLVGGQG